VIEAGKLGKSITQMAVACDTVRSTFDYWEELHPEFSAALTRAKALSQDWWENAGQTGMLTQGFNANVWKHMVASRFRDDYADRKETSLTGKNGGPVQVESTVIDASELEPEARDAIKAALLAALGE
jgi:hypothetical protein